MRIEGFFGIWRDGKQWHGISGNLVNTGCTLELASHSEL